MSLDQNLFTLTVTPHAEDPNVIDLVDPNGIIHYRKQRVPGTSYRTEVYDPMSESLLISASAPSATTKHKTLELYNPTIIVELKYTGTMTFKWGFKWEEHEFEWKREECFMLRKPDPPVLVAVTKEPPGRIKTSTVQILDYNLNRFDIQDRKGLEIVLLTALLTFQDSSDTYHTPNEALNPGPPTTGRKTSEGAPRLLPKPAPKTGADRIAEMQKEINEVYVEDEGAVNDYAQYCANLLQDEAMLFITVHSAAATNVPKVLQVVEQAKRIRYKAGLEELNQYVLYDATPQKGPRRINLNDDPNGAYAPPTNLTVHLSKIPMPELQPRATAGSSSNPVNQKEDKKEKATREAEEKRRKKEEKKAQTNRTSGGHSPSPSNGPFRAPSHQTHTGQPSQLNNPAISGAPPPRPPQNPYSHPHAHPGPPPPSNAFYGAGTVSYAQRPPPPGVNTHPFAGAMGSHSTGSYPAQPNPSQPYRPPVGPPPPIQGQRPPGTPSVVTGLFDKISSWRP